MPSRQLDITEHSTARGIELTRSQAHALNTVRYQTKGGTGGSPLVDVSVGSSTSRAEYDLRTHGLCGVFSVGDLDVSIRPRMHPDVVWGMLALSRDLPSPTVGRLSRGMALDAHVMESFLAHVEELLVDGLSEGYHPAREVGTRPRGSIDFSWFASPSAAALRYTYSEFSRDVPQNQLLAAALERVASLSRTRGAVAHRAQLLRESFLGVRPDPCATEFTDSRRYAPVTALARWILEDGGITLTVNSSSPLTQGIMYEPSRVFERYIQNRLEVYFGKVGGRVWPQGKNNPAHLDAQSLWRAFPDVVIGRGSRNLAVVDAKYKPRAVAPTRADLYQAIAYADAFQVDQAMLIYASTRFNRRHHRIGRRSRILLTVIELDVCTPAVSDVDAFLQDALTWSQKSVTRSSGYQS